MFPALSTATLLATALPEPVAGNCVSPSNLETELNNLKRLESSDEAAYLLARFAEPQPKPDPANYFNNLSKVNDRSAKGVQQARSAKGVQQAQAQKNRGNTGDYRNKGGSHINDAFA